MTSSAHWTWGVKVTNDFHAIIRANVHDQVLKLYIGLECSKLGDSIIQIKESLSIKI